MKGASRLVSRLAALLALTSPLPAAPLGAAPKHPDTYTLLGYAEPDSLDPAWPIELMSMKVILSIYEPLLRLDASGKLGPLLSERVPGRANGLLSADVRTYIFPIRKGVRFQDGSPLTPEDARYSILRFLLQDRADGPSNLLLQPLLGTAATRDASGRPKPELYARALSAVQVKGGSLVLRLERPYAPLPYILANACPIVSKAWAARAGDWDGTEGSWTRHNNPAKQDSPFFSRANGTGPFRLERVDRKNREFVLARHDGYWGKPARLARVVLKTVPEFSTRKLMLEAGDADAAEVDNAQLSLVRDLSGVRVIQGLRSPTLAPVFYFNFRIAAAGNPYLGSGRLDGEGIPPDFFSDKDVRKAFAHAFDVDAFIRDVYDGKARRAAGAIPEGMLGHDPRLAPYPFDPVKAAEHFRRAFQGRLWETGFKYVLVHNAGNSYRQTLCQMFKQTVEALNPKFHVRLQAMEWPAYLDAWHARKLPLMMFNLSPDFPDPHGVVFNALHSQGNIPAAQGYADARMDALIDAALLESDTRKRKELYSRLQALERSELPHLLFVQPEGFRVQRDWLKGWNYNPHSLEPRYDLLYKE